MVNKDSTNSSKIYPPIDIDDSKLLKKDLVLMLKERAKNSTSRLFDGFFDPTPPDPQATQEWRTAAWINAQVDVEKLEGEKILTDSSALDEGLFDHARVYVVDLKNSREDHREVVAKEYYPLRGWYWARLAPHSERKLGKTAREKIKEQWSAVPEHAKSEEENMVAWNKAGVSSPFFWGRISLTMPTPEPLREQFQKETMPVEILVSTLLKGGNGERAISRDRDLLYLQQELEAMKAVRTDPHDHRSHLYLSEGPEGLEKRIEFFERKEKEVILGMLHTVDDLSLRMTHYLGVHPREVEGSENKLYTSQLARRLATNIQAFYEWSALKEGYFLKPGEGESSAPKITQSLPTNFDPCITLQSLWGFTTPRMSSKMRDWLKEEQRRVRAAFNYVFTELTRQNTRQVYAQRDEAPHNIFSAELDHLDYSFSSNAVTKNAILDPGRSKRTPPELSKARVLTNCIVRLPYNRVMDYYGESVEQGERIAEELRTGWQNRDGSSFVGRQGIQYTDNGPKTFVLACVYEMMNYVGTYAENQTEHGRSYRFTQLLREPYRSYKNALLFGSDFDYKVPNPTVSLLPYAPKEGIRVVSENLGAILRYAQTTREPWADDRFKREMEKLDRFLVKRGIINK